MTIRTYRVWTWHHWLLYVGGFAFVTALALWFIETPPAEFTLLEKLPALAVPAAWAFGSWRLYRARRAYADRIVGVTKHGVSIVAWDDRARAWLLGASPIGWRWRIIEQSIEVVGGFWAPRPEGETSGPADRVTAIVEYLNGLALELVVRDGPLIERRHGLVARGLTYPKRCVVQVLPSELGTKEMLDLIGHELSHACLDALGFPQAAQHGAMRDAGCPWA